MELWKVLERHELTTLRVLRRGDRLLCTLSREWDPDHDFASYGTAESADQVVSMRPSVLGDSEVRELVQREGASATLSELERGMLEGRHEHYVAYRHAKLGVRVAHFIHSTALGRRNGFHALRAGGMRRHAREISELEVLRDGLNLSRAMSFKCAAAGIPFGGSKSSLTAPAFRDLDERHLGFIAFAIDQGQLMTGPDVGLEPELIDALGRRTPHILCGPSSPLGTTSGPTAEGVLAAVRVALEQRFGSANVQGRLVTIQGLGSVGLELARTFVNGGARVVAAERDAARAAQAKAELPKLELVPPDELLRVPSDILCPCALGRVLDRDSIAGLRTSLVYGAANNQLAADSTEEELTLAELLASRGILFQPDWTYTMGGILAGFAVYQHRDLASFAQVKTDVLRAAGDGTRDLLREADRTGETPTQVAVRWFAPLVYGTPA